MQQRKRTTQRKKNGNKNRRLSIAEISKLPYNEDEQILVMNKDDEDALIQQFMPVTIQDDAMFGAVMEDPKYCKPFLETILGVKIKKIVYLRKQEDVNLSVNAKSIRMDVYVEDSKGTVYDVEMQTSKNRNLAKRSRFYQGLIDLNVLAKGEDYNKLRKSLVIFICTFDPFGRGKYVYRFSNLDEETHEPLKDETWKIFVNANGYKGEVSDEFKALMRYIMNGEAGDSYTKALDEKVALVNSDKKWQVKYMTLAMKLRDARLDGHEEGREEGENRMAKLISLLVSDDRTKDVQLAADDKETRMRLYKEYGI